MFTFAKKTINITAKIYSGYISYIRTDTGVEVARSQEGVIAWAMKNNVNVKLDVKAQSATCYE
jgi:DNA topoisomerase IA